MICEKHISNVTFCPYCLETVNGWRNEEHLQAECKSLFDSVFPDVKHKIIGCSDYLLVHHDNNQTWGGAGAKSAKMGVRKGMPDFQLFYPNGHTFFIEMKTEKGRLSPAQAQRFRQLTDMGHTIYIARDIKQFISIAISEIDQELNLNKSHLISDVSQYIYKK